MHVCMCTPQCVQGSEDSLWLLILSLHHVDSGIHSQVVRLGGKHPAAEPSFCPPFSLFSSPHPLLPSTRCWLQGLVHASRVQHSIPWSGDGDCGCLSFPASLFPLAYLCWRAIGAIVQSVMWGDPWECEAISGAHTSWRAYDHRPPVCFPTEGHIIRTFKVKSFK